MQKFLHFIFNNVRNKLIAIYDVLQSERQIPCIKYTYKSMHILYMTFDANFIYLVNADYIFLYKPSVCLYYRCRTCASAWILCSVFCCLSRPSLCSCFCWLTWSSVCVTIPSAHSAGPRSSLVAYTELSWSAWPEIQPVKKKQWIHAFYRAGVGVCLAR